MGRTLVGRCWQVNELPRCAQLLTRSIGSREQSARPPRARAEGGLGEDQQRRPGKDRKGAARGAPSRWGEPDYTRIEGAVRAGDDGLMNRRTCEEVLQEFIGGPGARPRILRAMRW